MAWPESDKGSKVKNEGFRIRNKKKAKKRLTATLWAFRLLIPKCFPLAPAIELTNQHLLEYGHRVTMINSL